MGLEPTELSPAGAIARCVYLAKYVSLACRGAGSLDKFTSAQVGRALSQLESVYAHRVGARKNYDSINAITISKNKIAAAPRKLEKLFSLALYPLSYRGICESP